MKGRLHLKLRTPSGEVAERHAGNAVLRGGGELVARLFSGSGSPITHMGVGTSNAAEPDTFGTETLSNGGPEGIDPLTGETEVGISGDAFLIETDPAKRVVWVRLRATLPAAAAVGTIREAGLLAKTADRSVLYNRVTFAPVDKRSGDELTLFWEVSFPYGDVQWLM